MRQADEKAGLDRGWPEKDEAEQPQALRFCISNEEEGPGEEAEDERGQGAMWRGGTRGRTGVRTDRRRLNIFRNRTSR